MVTMSIKAYLRSLFGPAIQTGKIIQLILYKVTEAKMRLNKRILTGQMKDEVHILFVDVLEGFLGADHIQLDSSPFRL